MVLEDLKSFSWNRPWRPSVWCSVERLSNAFNGSKQILTSFSRTSKFHSCYKGDTVDGSEIRLIHHLGWC